MASRARIPRPRRALAVLLGLAIATTVPLGGAQAATRPTPTVTLVRQAPTLLLGAPLLHLDLQVTPGARLGANARVTFELARPVTSLVEFDDIVHGGRLPPSVDSPVVVPVDSTTQVGDRLGVDIPIQTPRDPVGQRKTLRIKDAGVYPLHVALSGVPGPDDPGFVTWLVVHDPRATARPATVAWVWQLDSVPTADTTLTTTELRRLERLGNLLAAGRGVPMTVVVHGHALAAWDATAQREDPASEARFARLQSRLGATDRSVVAAPWVRVDPLALANSGVADAYRDERLRTMTMLRDRWSVPYDNTTAWLDFADATSLQTERDLGTRHLALADSALVPVDTALEGERFTVEGSDIDAVTTSARLSELLFAGDVAPALRAQRAAAALAVTTATAPTDRNGIVISTPADWRGDASLVAAMVRVLDTATLTRPVVLGDLAQQLTPGSDGHGGPLVRRLRPRAADSLAVATVDIAATERRIDGAISLSADGRTHDDVADEAFLRALGVTISTPAAGRLLAVANRRVSDFTAGITVTAQSVTVTSERARIPVRFTNSTGVPVRVRVEFRSPKLHQNSGALVVLLPATPTNHTEIVPVTVKGSGQFRATLVVTSPDGQLAVAAPRSVSVNSTVFGSYGIWLTWGAVGFLAVWWIRHAWRVRHARTTTP